MTRFLLALLARSAVALAGQLLEPVPPKDPVTDSRLKESPYSPFCEGYYPSKPTRAESDLLFGYLPRPAADSERLKTFQKYDCFGYDRNRRSTL